MKKSILSVCSLLAILSASLSAPLLANELELSINEELIDLRLTTEYEKDFAGQLALMYSDFDNLGSKQISYKFFTQDQIDRFNVELGAKTFWLDTEDESGFGVGLGFAAKTELISKLYAGVEVYYSPDIITAGDFENVFEIDARLSYQLLENGSFFVGYRRYEADTGKIDLDIYDDPYFGLKFKF